MQQLEHFAANKKELLEMEISTAEAVQFRYRLDGRDDGWISVGAARQLQLAALPPGRLTLRLQGRAPGGQWQEAEPLVINVTPLWHERTSVRLLGVVLILVVIYSINAQRARTDRKSVV